MKIKSLLLMSMSALALAACSSGSDTDEAMAEPSADVSFYAAMPGVEQGTRTSFDVTEGSGTQGRTYTPLWSAREHLSVLYADNTAASFAGTNDAYAQSAQFNFEGQKNPLAAGMTIVATNMALNLENGGFIAPVTSRGIDIPGGDDQKLQDTYASGVITTTFKSEQLVNSGNKIDEASEILVSQPVKLSASATPVALTFKRLNALLSVNIVPTGAVNYTLNKKDIKEIQITTNDVTNDFGGTLQVNTADGSLTKLNGSAVSVSSAAATTGIGLSAYMSVLPTTIKQGSTFSLYVKTFDGRTYVRELRASQGDVVIPAATVTTFRVALGDKDLKIILNPKSAAKGN